MTRRILAAVSRTLRPAPIAPEVHFHQGPAGRPMPCFDGDCAVPHLDVG
ncbi:MAG TPA: hypothetical protein VGJ70_24525 [Solirubrobacteraceae bacterium]|jgi:hypothetical protein